MRCGVCHAARRARAANAATLATERDDDLVAARLATHARESVGKHATAQVRASSRST
jgi:hypothetical protein